MTTPLNKNLCSGGHEIYNFGRPFLGQHYCILSLYEPYPGLEKRIFLRNTSIFLPKITSPWDGGHETYNFLSIYPTDAPYQIW